MTRYDDMLKNLAVEQYGHKRLPVVDNGDTLTARLMRAEAAERAQRALWAGEFEDNGGSSSLRVDGSVAS